MTDKRVVIAGASGLIGEALVSSLRADGIAVTRLVRRPASSADEVEWLTETSEIDPMTLADASTVVNLNGASIGKLPWSAGYRNTLRQSRLTPTQVLASAFNALGDDAPHFVSASAVGYYGDRPGETLNETSTPGTTFLAELCVDWETAARAAKPARVALVRTAPLLHRRGVLKPLIALTRLGLSGPLGSGRQVWPWISLTDEVRAIRHIIDHGLTGPVNLTGPQPATASEIGRTLASAMKRPFLLPAPAWALRLGLSRQTADSLLLADANVVPQVLLESGFVFEHQSAAEAIAAAL